jgi:hypothetical protein
MRIIEVNPENWVATENIKVRVLEGSKLSGLKRFQVHGYSFLFVPCKRLDLGDLGHCDEFVVYEVPGGKGPNRDEISPDGPVVKGTKFSTDDEWMAHDGYDECLTRTDKDPVAAAVKVICNLY